MASSQAFVDHVVDQLEDDLEPTIRKMFGEYGLYCGGRIVAVVCDDQLFVKPTEPGRAYIGEPVEAPPYPGASPRFLISNLDDRVWLSELLRLTRDALPAPVPRKKKRGGTGRGRSKA